MRIAYFVLLCVLCTTSAQAIVKFDEGNLIINGIQLFQDRDVSTDYYYVPNAPAIATKPDGSLELLFIKYVSTAKAEYNGGLFHALVQFSLTPDELKNLEKELGKKISGAKVRGPVPMMEALKDGASGTAGFKIISSVLNQTTGKDPFTSQIVTSGHAPFLPGSRAAIAANLNKAGATLLWESFQLGTSDVSVAVEGYFEAAVKGYNAIVEAEVDMVYNHFSSLQNVQGGFTREQTRKIVDSLVQKQLLKIEVLDRSAGLGIKTDDMQKILDIITSQLTSLLFDSKEGWAQVPKQEAPADAEIKGRYKMGGLAGFFFGTGSQAYIPDNQLVLKERRDIRSRKFYLNLSKSTTIKVPVYSAGNLRGLYDLHQGTDRYFRIVNLDDPDFQQRSVHFQVNADFTEGFSDLINFVSVSFKKKYNGSTHEDVTSDLVFDKKDFQQGTDLKAVIYPRLGLSNADWLQYDYRVQWSIRGLDSTLRWPNDRESWQPAADPAVSLTPPFLKRKVEIDANRRDFADADIRTATVDFFVILGGKPIKHRSLILRQDDAVNTNATFLYHDDKQPILYRVNWYAKQGEYHEPPQELRTDYLLLIPPDKTQFQK